MNLFNFKNFKFISKKHETKLGAKLMHWLPVQKNLVKIEIVMPDAKTIKGLAESGIRGLKIGTIIQFERFGFCRLDKKEKNKMIFWFAHR